MQISCDFYQSKSYYVSRQANCIRFLVNFVWLLATQNSFGFYRPKTSLRILVTVAYPPPPPPSGSKASQVVETVMADAIKMVLQDCAAVLYKSTTKSLIHILPRRPGTTSFGSRIHPVGFLEFFFFYKTAV